MTDYDFGARIRDSITNLSTDERKWLLVPEPPLPGPAVARCIPGLVAKELVHVTLGNEAVITPFGQEVKQLLETQVIASCPVCRQIIASGFIGPSHKGSSGCRSGSLASGGDRTHCTCDGCF